MKASRARSAAQFSRTPGRQTPVQPTPGHIAWAIVQALRLWADARYPEFLRTKRLEPIPQEWFDWFLGEWRIARTVKVRTRKALLRYLNGRFRHAIDKDNTGRKVTTAAKEIRDRRWTNGGVPISLVSKVAFIFHPARFAPLDSYGRIGINRLRGSQSAGGEGHAKFRTYEEYLADFNRFFRRYEEQITKELGNSWTISLAKRLNCPPRALRTRAFRRKVFDNVLMGLGGRR
jgi:hypothetical protein